MTHPLIAQRTARLVIAAVLALAACAVAPRAHAQPPAVINVEIDWMADGTHSHQPSAAEIAAVVQMFACHGITLNAIVDDQIPHVNVIADSSFGNPNFFTWVGPNSFRSMRNQYFDNSGGGWHYCIFGHQYDPEDSTIAVSGSSGLGETGGDDFIVTLGSFTGQIGTPFDRAATFAHELGHNLGLTHSASTNDVTGANTPVYASIMSYQFQLQGVKTQMRCLDLIDTTAVALLKDLDYSDGRFPSVNENALDENKGVGMRPIDWNCSGTITGVVGQDLDGSPWCAATGPRTLISDKNDWALLDDNALTGDLPPARFEEPCISYEEVQRFKMSPSTCPGTQPTLVAEACIPGRLIWADAAWGGIIELGWGDLPFNSFMEAYNAAPATSAIYLRAGSYNTNGVLTTLDKPLTLGGTGGVTITR